MTAITRAQMETLLSLQEIEIQKREVQRILDAVAEKISSLDDELRSHAKLVEMDKQQLAELKARYSEYEEQIQDNSSLIGKIEEKRRAVKTNREYQSLIKEEEQLRTRKSQVEDEMLDCMTAMETLGQKISDREEEQRQLDEQVTSDKAAVTLEASESKTRFADLSSEIKAVEADLAPELLRSYVKIKQMCPDGKALAPVRNSICMGCHMNIPPQTFNELQRFDSLKFCPFCNRILYWDNT
jgi:hypothetical protein